MWGASPTKLSPGWRRTLDVGAASAYLTGVFERGGRSAVESIEDPRARIERLETEIAALEESAERAGKAMTAGRFAAAIGGVALVLVFLGLLRLGGLGFVLSVTAVLIGLVLWGSNKSTRDTLHADIAKRRAARDALIDRIDPRVVR